MKKFVINLAALMIGFVSLIGTLFIALPIAIITAIVGTSVVKSSHKQPFGTQGNVYDGEYEQVTK